MSVYSNWIFFNKTSVIGNGYEFRIGNTSASASTTMVLAIEATANTYAIHFEAKGDIGDYQAVGVWDESKMKLITEATETSGKLFTTDLTGKTNFRVRLSAIDGGNLSVQGKVIE